jgi:hypothetical protein
VPQRYVFAAFPPKPSAYSGNQENVLPIFADAVKQSGKPVPVHA